MFPQLNVPTASCFRTAMVPRPIFLQLYLPMFPQLDVPIAVCFYDSLCPQFYVSVALASHSSTFPQLYVPTVLCFRNSSFTQLYVPTCSYSSKHLLFCVCYVPVILCSYVLILSYTDLYVPVAPKLLFLQLFVPTDLCFYSSIIKQNCGTRSSGLGLASCGNTEYAVGTYVPVAKSLVLQRYLPMQHVPILCGTGFRVKLQ